MSSESKLALTENQSKITETVNDYFGSLGRQLGITDAPTYSATYKSCYTDSNDSGWFANSYNYNCILSDFAFYEVAEGSELESAIDTYSEPALEEGDSVYADYYGKIYNFQPRSSGVFSNNKELPYVIDVVKSNTYSNVRDALATGTLSSSPIVVAYANADEVSKRVMIHEEGTKTLERAKTYVVLKQGNEYFSKNIGCQIPKIMFCNSPV